MKTIDKLLDELKELQGTLKALSWIEARRPNLDLEAERKMILNERESFVKQLHFQVMGVNLK